jgi:hypothetical protein
MLSRTEANQIFLSLYCTAFHQKESLSFFFLMLTPTGFFYVHSLQPGSRSKVKSSVQRGLRAKLVETYPGFEPYIDEIIPKKAQLEAVKLCVLHKNNPLPPLPVLQLNWRGVLFIFGG